MKMMRVLKRMMAVGMAWAEVEATSDKIYVRWRIGRYVARLVMIV